MKRTVTLLGLFISFAATLSGQLNPTTHIKPATDSNMILITKEPNYRVYYRDAKSYLTDSAGMFKIPTDSVTFNNNQNDPDTAELQFDNDKGFLIYGGITAYPIEIGQSLLWLVKNQTGSSISKGTVVYANGTVGASGRITIAPFIADGTINNNYLLGITAETIPNGADGYVIAQGKIRKINTTAFSAGDVLYASATSAGSLQNTQPGNGYQKLPIAFVVHDDANGVLAVRVKTGETIGELHDVDTTGLTDGDVLAYDAATGLWKAEAVSGSASPGGTIAGAIQYNDGAGNFAAEDEFYYWAGGNTLYLPGTIEVADNVLHQGDSDTYIGFTSNKIDLNAGGLGLLSVRGLTSDTNVYIITAPLNLYFSKGIVDGNNTLGTAGQVLKVKSGGGVEWGTGGSGDPDQTLSWNGSTGEITISGSGGNTIDIDGRYLQTEVDGSVSNEGSLTVGAGTASTSVISSNTSGSTDVTLQAGTNITLSESGNTITITAASGSTSPGGSDSYVQYNNGGVFGGESTFAYDDVANLLTIEDIRITNQLRDAANTVGTNYELLTSTGSDARWKTMSFDVTDGVFDFNLDGATAASVDLSGANLSDAAKIFNNANAQNFYQISPTKITDWGTTASFTGDNIAWTSATDRWTVTYAGKYRVKCMINLDGTTEATETPIRFEIRVNGSKTGIYYHYFADPDRFVTISIDEVLELSATDYVEIYVQRGDAGTGKTVTFSATSESYFMVERINY